jgi:hypothetical protein
MRPGRPPAWMIERRTAHPIHPPPAGREVGVRRTGSAEQGPPNTMWGKVKAAAAYARRWLRYRSHDRSQPDSSRAELNIEPAFFWSCTVVECISIFVVFLAGDF